MKRADEIMELSSKIVIGGRPETGNKKPDKCANTDEF
jgi:hypothetical protein